MRRNHVQDVLAQHGLAAGQVGVRLASVGVILGGLVLLAAGTVAQQEFRVDDNGTVRTARSIYPESRLALRDLAFRVGEGDLVEGAPSASIRLSRAEPITVQGDGRSVLVRAVPGQPRAAAAAAGFDLGPDDTIVPLMPPRRIDAAQLQLASMSGDDGSRFVGTADGARLKVLRAATIDVRDGDVLAPLTTIRGTVGEALVAAGYEIFAGDVVDPAPGMPIMAGMTIAISRSRPAIVEVDGLRISTRTRATTVAALLDQEGVKIEVGDRIEPDARSALGANTVVRVTRIRDRLREFSEAVPPGIEYRDAPDLPIGKTEVVQQGVPGLRKWTTRAILEDGREVGQQTVRNWIETPPVPTIIRRGIKVVYDEVKTGVGMETYWAKVRVYTTAYSAATSGKPKGAPGYGITSTGAKAGRGIVAVDPSYIPYGTRMYVPGYGVAIAADTGGGIVGAMIDVCFEDEEPIIWASGPREIYLLGPAPPIDRVRHLVSP